jgi:hypothetical protein
MAFAFAYQKASYPESQQKSKGYKTTTQHTSCQIECKALRHIYAT